MTDHFENGRQFGIGIKDGLLWNDGQLNQLAEVVVRLVREEVEKTAPGGMTRRDRLAWELYRASASTEIEPCAYEAYQRADAFLAEMKCQHESTAPARPADATREG